MIPTHKLLSATLIFLLPTFAHAQDWTGAYVGGSVGGVSSDPALGAFIGYQHQFKSIVLGAELGYTQLPDAEVIDGSATASIDQLTDLNLRLGFAFDRVLVYGAYGATSFGSTDTSYDVDVGNMFGLGAGYKINENVAIGAQYNYRIPIISNIISGADEDVDLEEFALRVSYQF